ncbi:MAG: hypothetical protein Q4G09_00435 [Clostridia bacterium]|nr:hypothetical protein [Clostridia bacterium]
MSILNQAISYLTILAGSFTVFIILVSVFKIMFGDESDAKRYFTRIKHSIIAFILIITISNVQTLIQGYFPYEQSATSIGDFTTIQTSITDGALEYSHEDVLGRSVIKVDYQYYVNTGEKLVNLGTWTNSFKVWCSVYKLFDDCQGITRGSVAKEQYYISWEKEKIEEKYQGFLISSDIKGTIKSKEDFYELMGDWKDNKYEQYTWIKN